MKKQNGNFLKPILLFSGVVVMKKFDVVVNGYDKDEVNLFVKEVTVEYESCLKKLLNSRQEIESLKEKLKFYENLETELVQAHSSVTESNLNLKKLALKEANSIIY